MMGTGYIIINDVIILLQLMVDTHTGLDGVHVQLPVVAVQ